MKFLPAIIIIALLGCKHVSQTDSFIDTEHSVAEHKIDSLLELSDQYFKSENFSDSLFDVYLLKAFSLADDEDLHKRQVEIYGIVGKRYRNKSDFGVALYFYQKAIEIANQMEDEKLKAYLKGDMAVVFRRIDDNAKALNLHFQALEWAETAHDTFLILTSNNGIGNVYINYNNMPKAIEYFHQSLSLLKNGYKNSLSEAINTNNIGEAWLALGNSDSALYYVHKSYDINSHMGSKLGEAICENGLGNIYMYLKDFNKAIDHYIESFKLNTEVGNLIYLADNQLNLGKAYFAIANYKLSEEHLLDALKISQDIGSKSNIVKSLSYLAQLYRNTGKSNLALNFLDQAMLYKDSITAEGSHLKSEGMNALYKSEKQEREILILKQKDELSQLVLNRQKWFIISSIIMIIGGIGFAAFAAYQRKVTNRYIMKIEEQNINIRNSIRYAQKIQSAILPDMEIFKKQFDDSFILFKPRDLVSGDFYWYAEKNNLSIIAVADCTGHGVPGALMSMLGIAFLNEIINGEGITQPHLILNRLRDQVVQQLKQKGNLEDSKDGIDLSLVVINHSDLKLSFAGAYTPLYIIRNKKMIQLKADSMPIGYHPKKDYSFAMQEFDLQKGDCLYSSSDGYHDQFGGPEGTKFMIKNMKDLFLSIHKKPMSEQKKILDENIESWKGKFEQIDDIIVIGLRI